ncbi:MAG: hypothetical protein U0869_10290 [Chloroflexota bacterium]
MAIRQAVLGMTIRARTSGARSRAVSRPMLPWPWLLAVVVAVAASGCGTTIGDSSRAHESPLAVDLATIDEVMPGQPVLVTGRVVVPAGPLDCPLSEGCWIALGVPDHPSRSYPWYLPISLVTWSRDGVLLVLDDRSREVSPGGLVRVRAVVVVRDPGGRSLTWTTSVRRVGEGSRSMP